MDNLLESSGPSTYQQFTHRKLSSKLPIIYQNQVQKYGGASALNNDLDFMQI